MAEDKKYIQGLNEYIRQGEPQEQERGLSRSLDNEYAKPQQRGMSTLSWMANKTWTTINKFGVKFGDNEKLLLLSLPKQQYKAKK